MKHQKRADESLYRSMMADLEPGAAEYDRLMASGAAPARRQSTARPSRRTRLAQAVAIAAVAAGIVVLTMHPGAESTRRTASAPHPAESTSPDVAPTDDDAREQMLLQMVVEDLARRLAEQESNVQTYIL